MGSYIGAITIGFTINFIKILLPKLTQVNFVSLSNNYFKKLKKIDNILINQKNVTSVIEIPSISDGFLDFRCYLYGSFDENT